MLTRAEQSAALLWPKLGPLAARLAEARSREAWRAALIRVLQARTALRAELLRAELLAAGRWELAAVAAAPPAALVLPALQGRAARRA